MDFVEGLPKLEGCDSIMVVVDRLTKFAHFVLLHHPFTAVQVACVFWEHIIKLMLGNIARKTNTFLRTHNDLSMEMHSNEGESVSRLLGIVAEF